MQATKNLGNVLDALTTVNLVLPFVANMIRIIRNAQSVGQQEIPVAELLDGWQESLDKVDATGRRWLEEHGFEVPPPMPKVTPGPPQPKPRT